MWILLLRYKSQSFQLPLMFHPGRHEVNPRCFDAAVSQQVSQLGDIPTRLIKDCGKQVPKIVREHLFRLYISVFAKPLELGPDLLPIELFSAFGAKYRPGGDFLFFRVFLQLTTELLRQQDDPDFSLERNLGLTLTSSFHRDVAHFTDPNARSTDGLSQQGKPLLSQLFCAGKQTVILCPGQLASGVPKQAALIAFSRHYLYVHYPSDVLAGALLGILVGWMTWRLSACLDGVLV